MVPTFVSHSSHKRKRLGQHRAIIVFDHLFCKFDHPLLQGEGQTICQDHAMQAKCVDILEHC